MELVKEGTLRGHEDYIYCLVKLDNNYLASGGMDNTIYIWDLLINECLHSLIGHNSLVNCIIATIEDQIASCSDDCTIKLWNYKIGTVIRSLKFNFMIKALLFFHGDLIFADSNNKLQMYDLNFSSLRTLKSSFSDSSVVNGIYCLGPLTIAFISRISIYIWEAEQITEKFSPLRNRFIRYFKNVTEKTLSGHFLDVTCIATLNSTQLISCSDDKNIKIWNYHHGKCKKTLSGHKDRVVQVIKMNELHLVSCSKDETIKLWETIKGTCLYTITSKNMVLSIVKLNDNQIARGGRTTIKIIDIFNKLLI